MSFNGAMIFLRTEQPLDEITSFGVTEPRLSRQCPDDWKLVLTTAIPATVHPESSVVTWLAEETGRPVLGCGVFEDDFAQVIGSSSAGTWEWWLDVKTGPTWYATHHRLRALIEQKAQVTGDDFFPWWGLEEWPELLARAEAEMERSRPEAAASAVRWAAASGCEVSATRVEELFTRRREPFVEDLFFDLARLLGIEYQYDFLNMW